MTFSSAFKPIVDEIEGAVLDAAGYLVSSLASGDAIKATLKPDHTLVLNLDIESQRRILQRLGGSYPILAEEDESSHGLIESGGTYLLVDPLDGTASCKRFLGERGGQVVYGPLVGFVKDDVLSVASFYNIPQRKLFTAVRGEGLGVVETRGECLSPRQKRERLLPASCSNSSRQGCSFFIGKW